MARRYRDRRAEAIAMLGGRCAVCGNANQDELDIDHVDRRTKAVKANHLHSVSRDRFEAEVAGCQLLCHDPCHVLKTKIERATGRWDLATHIEWMERGDPAPSFYEDDDPLGGDGD